MVRGDPSFSNALVVENRFAVGEWLEQKAQYKQGHFALSMVKMLDTS